MFSLPDDQIKLENKTNQLQPKKCIEQRGKFLLEGLFINYRLRLVDPAKIRPQAAELLIVPNEFQWGANQVNLLNSHLLAIFQIFFLHMEML